MRRIAQFSTLPHCQRPSEVTLSIFFVFNFCEIEFELLKFEILYRVEAPEAICSRYMGQPFDEMVAAHIKVLFVLLIR